VPLVVLVIGQRTRIHMDNSILHLKRYWQLVCIGTRYTLVLKLVLDISKLGLHWNKLDMASIGKLNGIGF